MKQVSLLFATLFVYCATFAQNVAGTFGSPTTATATKNAVADSSFALPTTLTFTPSRIGAMRFNPNTQKVQVKKSAGWADVDGSGITNGTKQDITVSGDTWTLNNGTVTTSKIANSVTLPGTPTIGVEPPAGDSTKKAVSTAHLRREINASIKTFNVSESDFYGGDIGSGTPLRIKNKADSAAFKDSVAALRAAIAAGGGSAPEVAPVEVLSRVQGAGLGPAQRVKLKRGFRQEGDSIISGIQYSARMAGITGAGDKTSALQSLANNSTQQSILLDEQQDYTITNTYNAQGKEHVFTNGGRFTGGGTVQNIFIGGNHSAPVVDTSMAVLNPVNTVLYASDFGLLPSASAAYNARVLQRISAAINSTGGNVVLMIGKGVYSVGVQDFAGAFGQGFAYRAQPLLNLTNCSNVTIEGNGATFRTPAGFKVGSWNPVTGVAYTPSYSPYDNYSYWSGASTMIDLKNCKNVTIRNIALDGNTANVQLGGNWGSGYENSGVGINAIEVSDLVVENVHSINQLTDGIHVINYAYTDSSTVKKVTLTNSTFTYNGRQGLSWVGGNHLHAVNCEFSSTGQVINTATGIKVYSGPGGGIDIEPEADNNNVPILTLNGVFDNCRFVNNEGVSVLLVGPNRNRNHIFTDCTIENHRTTALWPNAGNVTVTGGKIIGTISSAYTANGYDDNLRLKLLNVRVSQKPSDYSGPVLETSSTRYSILEDTYAHLQNVTFSTANRPLPFLSNAEIEGCTLENDSSELSYPRGYYHGKNFIKTRGNIDLSSATFADPLIINGTERRADAVYTEGLDFTPVGNSAAGRLKLRFGSTLSPWGTYFGAEEGQIEFHSDALPGQPWIARYRGGAWETVPTSPGTSYTLPVASATVLGGIKIGAGLTVDPATGVVSASSGTPTPSQWTATGNDIRNANSGNVIIGDNTNYNATPTPRGLSLGGDYNATALTDYGAMKLKLYDDGSTGYGISVSPGAINHIMPALSGRHSFFINGTEKAWVNTDGLNTAGSFKSTDLQGSNTRLSAILADGSVSYFNNGSNRSVMQIVSGVPQWGTQPVATASEVGAVKPGAGLSVDGDGTLNVAAVNPFKEATLTTAASGAAVIETIAISLNSAVEINATYVAYDAVAGTVSRFGVSYLVKNVAGTTTVVDSEGLFGSTQDGFSGTVTTPTLNGTSVQLRVSPGTSNSIFWKVKYTLTPVLAAN